MLRPLLAAALSAAFASVAAAAPEIRIESPLPGWTSARTVRIQGLVQPAGARATLTMNGLAQSLRLREGRFEVDHVLAPGDNRIRIEASDPTGTAAAEVALHASIPGAELKVVLTWDEPDADVDLWVTDPAGRRCDFQQAETPGGGRLELDVTDGCGPEVFTLPRPTAGAYRIRAHLFSSSGARPVRCRVDVVRYEGTWREVRTSASGILAGADDQADLGEVRIESE